MYSQHIFNIARIFVQYKAFDYCPEESKAAIFGSAISVVPIWAFSGFAGMSSSDPRLQLAYVALSCLASGVLAYKNNTYDSNVKKKIAGAVLINFSLYTSPFRNVLLPLPNKVFSSLKAVAFLFQGAKWL